MLQQTLSQKSIFNIARRIDAPDARREYLDQVCGGDQALLGELISLLELYDRQKTFLDSPPDGMGVTFDEPLSEILGTHVGPYKIRELLGEGGMGSVYVAEQEKPVRRKVALKVVKAGMDSRQVLARFDAERQALALMDHPNIAKVLDAGTSESGRPYFVMELVRGVPITEFCDSRKLTTRQRLELFTKVCQAVQHAHQKGIIHRDIKPSNVLVTLHDDVAVPKVIDFGIAKATSQALTDQSIYTGVHQMLGTPLYMSPEQAEMNALDVDTRSDVYSLGVLLYELLTGQTPFEKDTLSKAGFDEMRRIIREDEPLRPSQRVSTLQAQALSTVSDCRKIEPRKLSHQLRGELDWIVMKTLEKDRDRRYETANGFAADVQRYLNDETVQACPPSAGYRLRKFARRNKGPVLAASLVLLALVAGVIGTSWGLFRAQQQRQIAEDRFALAHDVVNEMYSEVAEKWLENEPEMEDVQRRFLLKALAFYEQFAGVKGSERIMRRDRGITFNRAGLIHHKLGEPGKAEEAFGQAISLFQLLADEFPEQPIYRAYLADAHRSLGVMLDRQHRYGEAESHHRQAVAMSETLVAKFPKIVDYRSTQVNAMGELGTTLSRSGRKAEAEPVLRQAVSMREKLIAENPNEHLQHSNLGAELHNLVGALEVDRQGDELRRLIERAIQHQQRAVQLAPRIRAYHVKLANHYWALGTILSQQQQTADAEKAYRQGIILREKLVADFPGVPLYRTTLAINWFNFGNLLNAARGDQEAEAAYRNAQELLNELISKSPVVYEDQHVLGGTLHNLSQILRRRGEWTEAVRLLEQAIEHQQAALKLNPKELACRQYLRNHYCGLSLCLANSADLSLRNSDRAVEMAQKAIELDPQFGEGYSDLGMGLYRSSSWKAAIAALTKGLELSGDGEGQEQGPAQFILAMAHWQLGDKELAQKSYDQAVQWMDKNKPLDEELLRFRAEAAEMLGMKEGPK